MTQIDLKYVKKDNSNIRCYSDELWRALRKERFKPAKPDVFTNQMAAEEYRLERNPHVDFKQDIERFIDTKLSPKEASIFRLFVFGGRITQEEIAELLGICQASVAQTLKTVLKLAREELYGDL